jgi:C4-dicarboxylate-specific signal transduction histidine kinase
MVPLHTVKALEKIAMQLGTAIVRMKAQQALRESERELHKAKDDLKLKVLERTSWLQEVNEALPEEMAKHRETEAELLKAREAAVEAKAAFLASMSHEIRTP